MPAANQQPLPSLYNFLATQEELLKTQFPEDAGRLLKIIATTTDSTQKTPKTYDFDASSSELARSRENITLEEQQQILIKLEQLVTLPQKQTEEESLYLEQQLSELLEITVVSEIDGYTLPNQVVTIKAKKRSQNSVFGWRKQNTSFAITLPLHLTPKWKENPLLASEWYKNAKVLLLNPIEKVALICQVADVFPGPLTQYQATASPETVAAGKFWSRSAQGKALVYFISSDNLPENSVLSLATS